MLTPEDKIFIAKIALVLARQIARGAVRTGDVDCDIKRGRDAFEAAADELLKIAKT